MVFEKIKKIEIKKTERFFKKIPLFIAKHVFEFSLIVLFLSFSIGALLFYKYSVLDQRIDIGDLPETCLLEEEIYQEVLDAWQKHDQMFEQANSREYYNIFSSDNLID